jgi:hypothetical protein
VYRAISLRGALYLKREQAELSDEATTLTSQPGSIPFALITETAAGAARNLIKAAAPSAFLAAAETPPAKTVYV